MGDLAKVKNVLKLKYLDKKTIGGINGQNTDTEQLMRLVKKSVYVLRLYKEGSVGACFIKKSDSLDIPISQEIIISPFPYEYAFGKDYVLTTEEVSGFQLFWKDMDNYEIIEINNNHNLNLGLTRFNSSYTKTSVEDKFLDLIIAYETLFSKKDDSGDSISHKLALRYARFISNDFTKRGCEYGEMKKLYIKRNKLVHGDSKEKLKINDFENLDHHIRNALRFYITKYRLKEHDDVIKGIDFK